jgi:RNA polymerase sigma-70 factor (ECF subfamily)
MRELLDSLPFEQADVLTMHCVLGLTIQEMADMCHVPPETLRSRMRLAKRALRSRVLGDPRINDFVEESS